MRTGERGAALATVTVMLGLIAAITAGLSLSATTALALAGNLGAALEARAAAEGGVQHGLATALPVLEQWKARGFASPSAGFTDVLSGGAVRRAIDEAGFPATAVAIPGSIGQAYTVQLLDDDAPGRGLARADVDAISEDGDALHDANTRLVVRSTGVSRGRGSATVEAIVGAAPLPAVLVRGGLALGSIAVSGSEGHVHVRGDVAVDGEARIAGDLTATGAYQASSAPAVEGRLAGRARPIPLPDLHPVQFRGLASVVMAADGSVQTPAGDVLCRPPGAVCPQAAVAWQWTADGWRLSEVPAATATFYVEGDVVVEPVAAPGEAVFTLLATGSITVRGDLTLRPALPGVLFLAGGDLRVDGALRADAEEGLVAAGEQVAITGASRLAGVVLGAGRGDGSDVVTRSTLGGGLTVVSNGTLAAQGIVTVRVLGWRRHQAW